MHYTGQGRDARAEADETLVDAVLVHLAERHCDRVLFFVKTVGHVLEHVLGREVHLGRLFVVQLRLHEVVVAARIRTGEADHQVDDADVFREPAHLAASALA